MTQRRGKGFVEASPIFLKGKPFNSGVIQAMAGLPIYDALGRRVTLGFNAKF